ncbi:type VI secretion IcmF C-terminal domain-containing protein [Desulfovibrio piger]|nr:type VI secretion IcmF C-terminal domain-containing protein [Desulfovibrio piger]
MGRTLPLSAPALAQLTRANRVQSAFFSSGRELGINFTLEPYALDASLKQVVFVMDTTEVSYWHGIVQGRNFSWPENHSRAGIEITDLNGISRRNEARGDWAVFRILQTGAIKKQENNTCLIEIRQNGRWAQFLIQFRNRLNPFDPSVCSFTLPTKLQ